MFSYQTIIQRCFVYFVGAVSLAVSVPAAADFTVFGEIDPNDMGMIAKRITIRGC